MTVEQAKRGHELLNSIIKLESNIDSLTRCDRFSESKISIVGSGMPYAIKMSLDSCISFSEFKSFLLLKMQDKLINLKDELDKL